MARLPWEGYTKRDMNFIPYKIVEVERHQDHIDVAYVDDGEVETPGCRCILIEEMALILLYLRADVVAIFDEEQHRVIGIDQLSQHKFCARLDIHPWRFD